MKKLSYLVIIVVLVIVVTSVVTRTETEEATEEVAEVVEEVEKVEEVEVVAEDPVEEEEEEVVEEPVEEEEEVVEEEVVEEVKETRVSAGLYTDYSPEAYKEATGKKRVLFFYASWCPTCRSADSDLLANLDRIPADVVLLKTDYDTENELKKKYNVTYQHTFVLVDDNSDAVTVWNGGGADELISNTK